MGTSLSGLNTLLRGPWIVCGRTRSGERDGVEEGVADAGVKSSRLEEGSSVGPLDFGEADRGPSSLLRTTFSGMSSAR